MRFWAYKTERSLSDLARESLLEKATALETQELRERAQPRLDLS